jgi:hypothetical protein
MVQSAKIYRGISENFNIPMGASAPPQLLTAPHCPQLLNFCYETIFKE